MIAKTEVSPPITPPETPQTIADLLKATREFYTKKRRRWGKGSLVKEHDGKLSYCVLGAMSAVMTNEERLKRCAKDGESFSHPQEDFKGYDLIYRTVWFLGETLLPARVNSGTLWSRVYYFNDEHTRGRVLAALRKAEKEARTKGI